MGLYGLRTQSCKVRRGLGSPKQGNRNKVVSNFALFIPGENVQAYSSATPPSLRFSANGSWVILYVNWTNVLLFEPTGTHGSLHPVWEKLVTGAVFACALALACLFSILLLPKRGGGGGPVDFVSPLKVKSAQCKTQNNWLGALQVDKCCGTDDGQELKKRCTLWKRNFGRILGKDSQP